MASTQQPFAATMRLQFLWRALYYATVFAVNVAISRLLGPEGSGQLFYLTTQLALWVLVLSASLDAACGYFLASGKAGLKHLSLLAVGWTTLACLLFAGYLFFQEQWSLKSWHLLYLAGILLSNFFSQIGWALQRSAATNLALTWPNLILLGYLLVGPFFQWPFGADWAWLYFATALLQGCSALVIAVVHKSEAYNQPFPVKAIFRYAATALIANLVFFLLYRCDLWLLDWLNASTHAALGNYIQAGKFGQLLVILPQIMSTVIFPKVAGGQAVATTVEAFLSISRWFVLGFSLLACVLAFLGEWLFTSLLGPGFSQVNGLFLLLLPGILCICLLTLSSSIFSGLGKLRVNLLGAAWALGLALLLYWILMPLLGVHGAAIGSSLAYAANLGFSLWRLQKIHTFSWKHLWLWTPADLDFLIKRQRP